MSFLSNFLKGGGVIDKVTGIVGKAVVDKDKRNEMIYEIALLLMQSRIAPYVRALLALIIVVSVMFFGDSITLDLEGQKYALYSVIGFYFFDFLLNGFKGKKN